MARGARPPAAARRAVPAKTGRRIRAVLPLAQVNENRDPLFGHDEREKEAEEARRAARPYSIAVGVLFLGLIVFAGINALSNGGSGPGGSEVGQDLPRFAAPTATGSLDGDANVDPEKACKIHEPDAIRICDYFDRPLVMVAWFSKCGGHCEPQLDAVERIRRRFPGVAFIGLDVRDSKDKASKAVTKKDGASRWPLTVTVPSGSSIRWGWARPPSSHILAACWRARRSAS